MENSFFILGCQRSGTTLLRLILDSHPKIHCFDESKSYSVLANKKLLKKELKKYTNLKSVGYKTPSFTEQMNNDVLIEPVNQFRIKNEFHDKKLVFIYRDVYAVVSSMKNYIQTNGLSWLENWSFRTFSLWKKTDKKLVEKFRQDFDIMENSRNKILLAGALYWKIKNAAIINYENKNKPIIKISYEKLCENPKVEITKVMNFLDLPWHDNLLCHEKIDHDEVDEMGKTIGNINANEPIYHNKKTLTFTDSEKKEIFELCSDIITKLDYPNSIKN